MKGVFKLFADFSANSETLRGLRNKAHINALYTVILICVIVGLFYIFAPIQNTIARNVIVLSTFTLAALYSAALISTKYTDIGGATGYFSTIWTAIIILFLCCVSQGVPYSDASPLIIAPIVMSFCFLGLRGGIILNVLFLCCFTSLGITALSGVVFIDLIDTKLESLSQMIIWGVCLIALISVLFAYEEMLLKLQYRRGGSETDLRQKASDKRQYPIVTREDFEHFLHEAEQRCIQYENSLVLSCIHLPASPPDFILKCMQEIQPLLRSVDTLVRTGEYTISITLENMTSEMNAKHFLDCLNQHLIDSEIFSSTQAFKLSYACMPGPCNSWQDLVRLTKPYYSQTNLSTALPKSESYVSS